MADEMEVEIMPDGVIKVSTSSISEANHMNADELLAELESAMGGTRVTEQREHEFWKTRSVVRNKAGKVRVKGN